MNKMWVLFVALLAGGLGFLSTFFFVTQHTVDLIIGLTYTVLAPFVYLRFLK